MAGSKLTPASLSPDLQINGGCQRWNFNIYNPLVKVQAFSKFVPTFMVNSIINIETRNYRYSGFRFKQTSTYLDDYPFGIFSFQNFVGDGDGTDIWSFDGNNFSIKYPVDVNNQQIKNVLAPTADTDAANKSYVDAIASGAITLTGNVTGSGVLGTPFTTTIASTLNNIPLATGSVNMNSQNIINSGNVGIGVAAPTTPLQFSNATTDCKIALYKATTNNFQVFGLGVTTNTLKYSVDSSTSSHVFYCGASTTTSTELFRIAGTGYATVKGGVGTFYSRFPSVHISLSSGTTTTTPAAVWTKLAGTTTASVGAVQFTTSSNRITFTGSHLAAACVGMVSGSAVLKLSTVSSINICIYKNGTTILTSSNCVVTSTSVSVGVSITIPSIMVSLSPGDYLEVWALSTGVTITTQFLNLSFVAC